MTAMELMYCPPSFFDIMICGPHFLHYMYSIESFVIGFKSGVKTRVMALMDTLSTQREAYKDDPFILAKHANQIWNEFGLNVNCYYSNFYILTYNPIDLKELESKPKSFSIMFGLTYFVVIIEDIDLRAHKSTYSLMLLMPILFLNIILYNGTHA
ncbi:hypothetical protein ACJX0J_036787, partial [Zea mays]